MSLVYGVVAIIVVRQLFISNMYLILKLKTQGTYVTKSV